MMTIGIVLTRAVRSGRVRLILLIYVLFLGSATVTIPFITILLQPVGNGGLGLGPAQVSAVACGFALAPLGSLLLVSHLELRGARPQRVLSVLLTLAVVLVGLMGGLLAWYSPTADGTMLATAVTAFLFAAFNVVNQTAVAILFAMVLSILGNGRDRFYVYRSAGTAGYISAGLILGFGLPPISPGPFWLAAAVFAGAAAFCLISFPAMPSPSHADQYMADTVRPSSSCGIPTLLGLALSVSTVARVFDLLCNPFLINVGIVPHPSAVQMVGQSLEMGMLIGMPLLLRAISHRWFLILGSVGWVWLYACFALGAEMRSPLLIILGLPTQGFNCTFLTCIAIMMAHRCDDTNRGRAQGLLIAAQGAGGVAGSILVGLLVSTLGAHSWGALWTAAMLLAVGVSILAWCLTRHLVGDDH